MKHKKIIFLFAIKLTKLMDFIDNNIKRLNLYKWNNFETVNRIPKINHTELEQINDQIFQSIKTRMQNLENDRTNYQSFEKIVNQMRGQDTSPISNLTKDFEKRFKKDIF